MSAHPSRNDAEPTLADARVEFRVWDPPDASVSTLMRRGVPNGRDERHDVYLVGPDHTVNAKVRDSSLEVKRLIGTDGGLQRWRPDAPIELPLTDAQLDALLDDLGAARTATRTWSELDRLDPGTVVAATTDGMAIAVAKRRQRFDVGSVRAEFTEARFFGEPHSSIAVEAPEEDAVRQAIGELDLVGENRPMHRAAADAMRRQSD